jgi:hypothetical protein
LDLRDLADYPDQRGRFLPAIARVFSLFKTTFVGLQIVQVLVFPSDGFESQLTASPPYFS